MTIFCTKYPECDCSTIHNCKHPEYQISKPAKPISTANDKQIAGDHYKKYGNLQPWDVVTTWNMGYLDGTALKYLARWKDKGGIDDLKKAIHFIEKLIEVTEQEAQNTRNTA